MFRTRSSTAGPGLPPLWGIAGKAGYVVCCIVSATVLLAAGWAHYAYQNLAALGQSHALVSGPSIGEQNILLMGLESRTYWNGQILPNDILGALHAGSRQGVQNGVGGNATNTLILIHIPAGGGKAVGISIPRDDWVTFPQPYDGQSQGKIDQAYGFALDAKEQQLETANHSGLTDQIAFQGNEAGRAAAVATVQQITGMHIDHFAEVNLWGFYEMARALGGVNVCLNHPIWPPETNSGFYAKRAGYQHLSPKLALAFVRQRDGLTNGDLDRTHRQQAFIDSVLHQIRGQGVLTDLGRINSMLSTASQYVITDAGWDLADFATQMQSLTPGHIVFRTAPLAPPYYEKIAGQDANVISVPQIQQFVQENFFPAPATGKKPASKTATPKADPAATTVDVYNGGNTPHLAGDVANALVQAGYKASSLGNAPAKQATTQVLYGSGVTGSADALASAFGVTARPSSALAAGTVKIVLGVEATTVPSFTSGATASSSPSSSASSSSSPTPAAQASLNPSGGAVHAVNGIPCVD
ncbi:MAG TPA: LCP family protein [Streptosporangiaceae bacterium]